MKTPLFKMAIIGLAIAAGFASYLITKKPDGVVEQAAEAVLRTQGVDIDLSPDDEVDAE